jgi:hypothetical protein
MKATKKEKEKFAELTKYIISRHETNKEVPFNAFQGIKRFEKEEDSLSKKELAIIQENLKKYQKILMNKPRPKQDFDKVYEDISSPYKDTSLDMPIFGMVMTTKGEEDAALWPEPNTKTPLHVRTTGGPYCFQTEEYKNISILFRLIPNHALEETKRMELKVAIDMVGYWNLVKNQGQCETVILKLHCYHDVFQSYRRGRTRDAMLDMVEDKTGRVSAGNFISERLIISREEDIRGRDPVYLHINMFAYVLATGGGCFGEINFGDPIDLNYIYPYRGWANYI